MSFREEVREVVREVLLEVLPQFLRQAGQAPAEGEELAVDTVEAARRMGVSPDTVRSWIASGDLPAKRTPGGRQYLVKVVDLRRFLDSDLRPGSGPPPGSSPTSVAAAHADRILAETASKGASKR